MGRLSRVEKHLFGCRNSTIAKIVDEWLGWAPMGRTRQATMTLDETCRVMFVFRENMLSAARCM